MISNTILILSTAQTLCWCPQEEKFSCEGDPCFSFCLGPHSTDHLLLLGEHPDREAQVPHYGQAVDVLLPLVSQTLTIENSFIFAVNNRQALPEQPPSIKALLA